MNSSTSGLSLPDGSRLIAVAQWCAALCLLVAPFRASAGLRAGLLLVAAGLLLVRHGRDSWRALLPARSIATDAILCWLAVALLWCALSRDLATSLNDFKGDVLTPLLSGAVFFALTRDENDLGRWARVLAVGLVLLLLAFFIDPFKQGESVPRPWYGGVGPVSTWVVTVAALLPALWFAHARPGHPIQRWALAIMFLVIGLAFLSGNRTVWIALAAMVMTFAVLAWRDEHRLSQGRALLFLLLGLALLAVLFVVSRQIRFEGVVSDAALPTFEAHDNRIVLWQKAIDMVGERPFAGRGFGREVVESELVARFTEPYYRNLFLQGHNLILNYALQMGVAGIVAILLLFTALAMWFLDLARRVPSARMYAVSGCVLVVGVVAKNMTDDFFINQNALLFWAIAGMLAGVVRQPQPDARTPGNG